jgi:hypothetical protein
MFFGKVIISARPSLRPSRTAYLMICLLLSLSGLALAGTHETFRRNLTDKEEASAAHLAIVRDRAKEASKPAESALRTPSASAIRSIKVTKDYTRGGMLMATIELDGQPQYTHFTLPSPYRLVIDVQHVSTDVPALIQVGMANVKRVRLGKMDDTVRVVFDANKPLPYEINNEGTTIRVWFGEQKVNAAANNPALSPSPTNAVKPSASTNESPVALKPTPLSGAAKSSAVPPVSSKPPAAEVEKNVAQVTTRQPVSTPHPVRLQLSPQRVSQTLKPRLLVSTTTLRLAPGTNHFPAKASDAPPLARTVKPASLPKSVPSTSPLPPAKTPTGTTPETAEVVRAKETNPAGGIVSTPPMPLVAQRRLQLRRAPVK